MPAALRDANGKCLASSYMDLLRLRLNGTYSTLESGCQEICDTRVGSGTRSTRGIFPEVSTEETVSPFFRPRELQRRVASAYRFDVA